MHRGSVCTRTAILLIVLNGFLGACQSSVDYPSKSCGSTADDSIDSGTGLFTPIASYLHGAPSYHVFEGPRPSQWDPFARAWLYYMVHESSSLPPKALLVLIAGGQLNASIYGDVDGGPVSYSGGNFLVRSAHLFAARGYRVLTIDAPSDSWAFINPAYPGSGAALDGYRTGNAHAVDLAAMIARVNDVDRLPVVLVGTSRGAISSVAQYRLADALALSAPVTSGSRGDPISSAEAHAIDLPVQVLWHVMDGCSSSPPGGSGALRDAFPDADGLPLLGGFNPYGTDPCGAYSYHGFLGIEACAVEESTDWLDGLLATLPVTKPQSTAASVITAANTAVDIDLAALSAASGGGALSFSLPYLTTESGGVMSLNGTVVTYSPPTGAGGIYDSFVYRVDEQGGGHSEQVIAIEVP